MSEGFRCCCDMCERKLAKLIHRSVHLMLLIYGLIPCRGEGTIARPHHPAYILVLFHINCGLFIVERDNVVKLEHGITAHQSSPPRRPLRCCD